MKKKFDIKLVLVMILAVVLSFTMFACNDDGTGGGKPQKETIVSKSSLAEFYAVLKSGLKTEGADAISAADDLELELDLSALVGFVDDQNIKPENGEPHGYKTKVNLGLKAKLLLDRTTTGEGENVNYGLGGNTGLKLTVYNQSEPDKTVLAVTYLLKEPQFGYVEMLGQKIKVAFDSGYNDNFVSGISGAFSNKIVDSDSDGVKDVSVADVLNAALKGTGASWEITTAIDNIVEVLGLVPLIESSIGDMQDLIDTVLGEDSSLIKDGKLNIDGIMSSATLGGFFNANQISYRSSSVVRYELKTSDSLGTIIGMLPVSDEIKGYLKEISLGVDFDKDGNEIDNLRITVDLPALKNNKTNNYPSVSLTVNDLDVEKVNGLTDAGAKDILDIDAGYKDTFDFGFETTVNVSGLSLSILDPENPADLSGAYTLKVHAMIDLFGKDAANKTKVFATLYKNGTEHIATIEANGAEKTVTIKTELIKMFGTQFHGIVLSDFDIVGMFQAKIKDMVEGGEDVKPPLEEDDESNGWNQFNVNVTSVVRKLAELISTTDKSVEFKASNIIGILFNCVDMDWIGGSLLTGNEHQQQRAKEFIAKILTASTYDAESGKYITAGYVTDFYNLGIVKSANGRKISKQESIAIYDCLAGGETAYISAYKAAKNGTAPTDELIAKFKTVYDDFAVAVLSNVFGGSEAFGKGDNYNPSNFLVDLLVNGSVSAKIGYDDNGITFDMSLGIKDKFSIEIAGGKLALEAGNLPDGSIDVPENPENNGWLSGSMKDFVL